MLWGAHFQEESILPEYTTSRVAGRVGRRKGWHSKTLHWEPPGSKWFPGVISNLKTEAYEMLVPLGLSGTAGDQEEWEHLCGQLDCSVFCSSILQCQTSGGNLLGAHRMQDPLPLSKQTKQATPESSFRKWQILIWSSGSKTATVMHFVPWKTRRPEPGSRDYQFYRLLKLQIIQGVQETPWLFQNILVFLVAFIYVKTNKNLPKTSPVQQTKDVANCS